MVSIVGQESPLDLVGKIVGDNISQNLPGAVNQGYLRGLGLSALDQAQKDISTSGGDPFKIAMAFARAGAQNPNLDRALGPLYQAAMTQATAQGIPGGLNIAASDMAGEFGAPQGPTLGANAALQPPGMAPGAQTTQAPPLDRKSNEINTIAKQAIAELRPDFVNPNSEFGAINTFNAAVKQDLTPQEEARLRQKIMDEYKNPAIADKAVERTREGIKNRYNELLSKYNFDAERLNQIKDKWNTFTQGSAQRLEPHIGKYEGMPRTQDVFTNKYNEYAGNLPTNLTPQQMHTEAMKLLQDDIREYDAISQQPSMPPIRTEQGVKDYIDTYKRAYKEMADRGFTEALREDAIINKDMGNEEFHSMIWGDQTSKPFLNEIHAIKAPQEYDNYKGQPRYNPNFVKEKDNYINKLSNKLANLNPKDDLMLVRAMVLDNGGTVKDFGDALQEAEKKGLKLSDFQRGQLQEIAIPRTPPLYEIFSQTEPSAVSTGFFGGGIPSLLNWRPFINYIRGKR